MRDVSVHNRHQIAVFLPQTVPPAERGPIHVLLLLLQRQQAPSAEPARETARNVDVSEAERRRHRFRRNIRRNRGSAGRARVLRHSPGVGVEKRQVLEDVQVPLLSARESAQGEHPGARENARAAREEPEQRPGAPLHRVQLRVQQRGGLVVAFQGAPGPLRHGALHRRPHEVRRGADERTEPIPQRLARSDRRHDQFGRRMRQQRRVSRGTPGRGRGKHAVLLPQLSSAVPEEERVRDPFALPRSAALLQMRLLHVHGAPETAFARPREGSHSELPGTYQGIRGNLPGSSRAPRAAAAFRGEAKRGRDLDRRSHRRRTGGSSGIRGIPRFEIVVTKRSDFRNRIVPAEIGGADETSCDGTYERRESARASRRSAVRRFDARESEFYIPDVSEEREDEREAV